MKYKIYEGNFDRFDKKMKRIIKKAEKYPECTVKYEVLGDVYEEREHRDLQVVYKEVLRFIEVDVEGTVINNGWRFIATLEHIEEGKNVVRQADTSVEIPERFYTCKTECEHCHIDRYRKDTYIVYNEDTKEFRQVGKTCLQEYTHGLSADAVAQLAEIVGYANDMSDYCYDGVDHTFYGELQKVLEYEQPLVEMEGYKPSRYANGEYNEFSTKNEVYGLYEYYQMDMRDDFAEDIIKQGYTPQNADKKYIADALKWIADANVSGNDYLHNLQNICTEKYINMDRDLGIAVSLFNAYEKYLGKERKRVEQGKSQFVGERGDKITFVPTEKRLLTSFDTIYGEQFMYQFTDANWNIFIWKTSVYLENLDEITTIRGTVKKHNVYKGTNQTELTRCKALAD